MDKLKDDNAFIYSYFKTANCCNKLSKNKMLKAAWLFDLYFVFLIFWKNISKNEWFENNFYDDAMYVSDQIIWERIFNRKN